MIAAPNFLICINGLPLAYSNLRFKLLIFKREASLRLLNWLRCIASGLINHEIMWLFIDQIFISLIDSTICSCIILGLLSHQLLKALASSLHLVSAAQRSKGSC